MAKFIIAQMFICVTLVSTIYGSCSTDSLHEAAKNMHDKKIMCKLLKKLSTEKINVMNADHENAAHVAMQHGNFVFANLLAARGIDLTQKNKNNKRQKKRETTLDKKQNKKNNRHAY